MKVKTSTNKKTNLAHAKRYSRWIATSTYRSERGPVVVEHYVEEIEELHNLIEHGPDWHSLVDLKVVLNPLRTTYPDITMEAAAKL
jgi:hypothetical protein